MSGESKRFERDRRDAEKTLRRLSRLICELAYPPKGRHAIPLSLVARAMHLRSVHLMIETFGHQDALELMVAAINQHRPSESQITLWWGDMSPALPREEAPQSVH